ncbi:uncharacterized protein N7458_008347 [Penicillium daleae]|uniref:Uncharacterized protein n=1 Tax=Penicillium daleae TaxID=63821 RepID=A0AAD6G1Z6_9EURO|nr:uncharacterized protein N7458_008347 [Penicillium daleae]KAJ5444475.1 hypothetical protein N7458_008347 [Penicillium daleae]
MSSMRAPLGSIDTRLTMTDTLANDPLAFSFASIVAFDNALQPDDQPLDCKGIAETKMNNRVQFVSDTSHEPTYARGIGKPYPRLELDVAMDNCHSLDGFAEPVNPRNTPATTSCCESPEDSARPVEPRGMRTSSAPQIQSLAFEWFDGKSEGHMTYVDDDADSGIKAQRRRFSADDEPRASSSIIPSNDIAQTTRTGSAEKIDDSHLHVPCVRPSPKPHPARAGYSVPMVERKVDYLASTSPSHRQFKHYKKWRGSSRALVHRVSPYRSPPKVSKVRLLDGQPDVPSSSLLSLPGHQGDPGGPTSETNPSQETVEHNVPMKVKDVANGPTDVNVGTPNARVSDLVGLSLSIYRVRHPGQQPALSMNGSAFQVEMTSTPFPCPTTGHEGEEVEHAGDRPESEDLVFHTYLVLPAFVARIPMATFSVVKRAKTSRLGTILLYLEKMFWSVVIAFFLAFLAKFGRPGRRPGSDPGGLGLDPRAQVRHAVEPVTSPVS